MTRFQFIPYNLVVAFVYIVYILINVTDVYLLRRTINCESFYTVILRY